MTAIRVLIVDDSAAARRALSDLLSEDPDIVVSGLAKDAFDAADKMREDLPDVILLDLELPRMNGLTFLKKIMSQRPIPVVICSSHTAAGSSGALKALELGACDVVGKPTLHSPQARLEAQVRLTDAVRAASHARHLRGHTSPKRVAPLPRAAASGVGPKLTADAILPPPRLGAAMALDMEPIVVIGASTGGTEALAHVLKALPTDCPPIVIVQHMPEKFTAAFAKRLNSICAVEVREAKQGDQPARGVALIAPGDHHILLCRKGRGYRIDVVDGPQVSRHRPSVDVLFRSTAICAGKYAIGFLLTGMGDDGAKGLLELKQAGADTIIQDEASSVVWGMPGEAFKLGASNRTVALNKVAPEIMRFHADNRVL
ncbi:protein-glutamate methylesterase/protein-glutamine glutaminase [Celeribacter marinus]|uniref:protein-glutamate methylesterase/protein-glutamine glutaminase n=1 Tax=Celeribacter marinus TaxID=1397108 RepID=UPI003F6CB5E0